VLSARHEAGHAIVAHALGRHLEWVYIGDFVLPVGHPNNEGDDPLVRRGYCLAGPLLADAISARHAARLPFTDEQADWLLTEAVITPAGYIGQASQSWRRRRDAANGAASDREAFESVAFLLGQAEDVDEETTLVSEAFETAAFETAKRILIELMGNLMQLTDMFADRPGEWTEEALQTVLRDLGSPLGSHRPMLQELEQICRQRGDRRRSVRGV
jgi:hypothetical protein